MADNACWWSMEEFVSEAISPHEGGFDTVAMAAGEPGLPRGFCWRDESYDVVERLDSWKQSGAERGRLHGERYLRRHYCRLKMSDGAVWTVYFVRQAQQSGSPRQRWFLCSIERKRA